jgi:hypothetical protein
MANLLAEYIDSNGKGMRPTSDDMAMSLPDRRFRIDGMKA